MADGIPAVTKGACVFAHDRVDVFVRQFGWYRRSNRLLSHDAFASWDESLFLLSAIPRNRPAVLFGNFAP